LATKSFFATIAVSRFCNIFSGRSARLFSLHELIWQRDYRRVLTGAHSLRSLLRFMCCFVRGVKELLWPRLAFRDVAAIEADIKPPS